MEKTKEITSRVKIKHYSRRKIKKTRFKRKLSRAMKRGEPLYGGFIKFTDAIEPIKAEREDFVNEI